MGNTQIRPYIFFDHRGSFVSGLSLVRSNLSINPGFAENELHIINPCREQLIIQIAISDHMGPGP